MAIGLAWIIGIYGIGALMVHVVHRYQYKKLIHVALVTMNNETQIEGYLRTFLWISAIRGRSIYVTVFDSGSTDETLTIVTKFALERDNIKIETSTEGMSDYMITHSEDTVLVLQLMNRTAVDGWLIPNW